MKALLLLSGGFDSPVAAHLMQKKGVELIAINFSQEPLTDEKETEKAKKLSDMLGINKFISLKIGKELGLLVDKCQHKFYYILQRRFMLRIATLIAEKEGCSYLVTGDNLAQVGSQTLSNISVIDKATKMSVLRPLLSYDKVETMDIAREIGTYDTSCGPELCALLGPKHPATSSTPQLLEKEEKNLDIDSMIADAMKTLQEL